MIHKIINQWHHTKLRAAVLDEINSLSESGYQMLVNNVRTRESDAFHMQYAEDLIEIPYIKQIAYRMLGYNDKRGGEVTKQYLDMQVKGYAIIEIKYIIIDLLKR